MKAIKRILHLYSWLERIVLTGIFTVMFLTMSAGIVMRYVFNNPLMFTEELLVTLTPCMTILGIGYGIRYRTHISVDIFYSFLPQRGKHIVSAILCVLMIITMILVVQHSFSFVSLQMKNIMITIPWISRGAFYVSIPAGGIIAIVYLLLDLFDQIVMALGKPPVFNFRNGGVLIE